MTEYYNASVAHLQSKVEEMLPLLEENFENSKNECLIGQMAEKDFDAVTKGYAKAVILTSYADASFTSTETCDSIFRYNASIFQDMQDIIEKSEGDKKIQAELHRDELMALYEQNGFMTNSSSDIIPVKAIEEEIETAIQNIWPETTDEQDPKVQKLRLTG